MIFFIPHVDLTASINSEQQEPLLSTVFIYFILCLRVTAAEGRQETQGFGNAAHLGLMKIAAAESN